MRHRLARRTDALARHLDPAALDRAARQTRRRVELEADELLWQSVHGGAAQHPAPLVEEVAVRRLAAEQVGDLVDQALEHGVEPQLRRDGLGGLDERLVLPQPARVLLEQLRGVHCEPELVRDGLEQRDVGVRPGARARAMDGEHAHERVEDDDRRGERGAAAETAQHLTPAEVALVEAPVGRDVRDGDRAALAEGEVRGGQRAGEVADRRQAVGSPFAGDRHRSALLAEPHEAAVDLQRRRRLGHGDLQEPREVELGANLLRDAGHQPLPLERALEGARSTGSARSQARSRRRAPA